MVSETPLFSIIVPTCNRYEQLKTCLRTIRETDYPRTRFEVIVVDDGGESPLENLIGSFYDSFNLALIRQKNAGPAAARNTGAARARGKFLVFTDDDCSPAADWLQKLESRFSETPDRLIGGRIINELRSNPFSAASQLIFDAAYIHHNPDHDDARFMISANMAVPRDRFHSLGGFNTAFRTAEDREFCDRWRMQGYRITYAPEVVVRHSHYLTLLGFCKHHFNYGRGAFSYKRIRAGRKSGTMENDMRFHLHLPVILKEPMSEFPQARIPLMGMLLVVWELVNTAGFFYEKVRSGKWEVGRKPGDQSPG